MSGVLGGVYAYFLQQATTLAQAQLAFERQEPSRELIQRDYWRGPLALEAVSGFVEAIVATVVT